MRPLTLQTLTWGTVAAAVCSALWLASVDSSWSDLHKVGDRGAGMLRLPKEPTGAGAPARPSGPSGAGDRTPAQRRDALRR